MRVDFSVGALKFMYVGEGKGNDNPVEIFENMIAAIGKFLPHEVVSALIAADPEVVEAMRKCELQKWSNKFEEEVIKPIKVVNLEAKSLKAKRTSKQSSDGL